MKQHIKAVLLGVLAGFMISLGGLVNIVCIANELKILGNMLFSLGLLTICALGFYLFTGKIGFVLDNKKDYLWLLLEAYIGNIIGTVGTGYLLRLTALKSNEKIMNAANTIGMTKLLGFDASYGQTWYSILLLSFFCGLLVYLAVYIFTKTELHAAIKVTSLILLIGAFVICGFEHCIADMFYLAFSNTFSRYFGEGICCILIATIGNSISAILLNSCFKFCFKKQ